MGLHARRSATARVSDFRDRRDNYYTVCDVRINVRQKSVEVRTHAHTLAIMAYAVDDLLRPPLEVARVTYDGAEDVCTSRIRTVARRSDQKPPARVSQRFRRPRAVTTAHSHAYTSARRSFRIT